MSPDFWATLPPTAQAIFVSATGDFLGGLTANLVDGLLKAVGQRAARRFQPEPQRAALQEALAEALARALSAQPLDAGLAGHYCDLFGDFLRRPAVQEELALLLDPRPDADLDLDLLRREFEAAGYEPDLLPGLDFDRFLATLAGAFYDAAAARQGFQGAIEIGLLRGMVKRLAALVPLARRATLAVEAVAADTAAITAQVAALLDGQAGAQDLRLQIRLAIEQGLDRIYSLLEAITAQVYDQRLKIDLEDNRLRLEADAGAAPVPAPTLAALAEMLTLLRRALPTAPTPAERAGLEARLRQHVARWFERLTFQGMTHTPTPIVLPLQEVYVDLWGVTTLPREADTLSAHERRVLLRLKEETDERARRELEMQLDALQRQQAGRDRLERRPVAETLRDAQQRAVVVLGDPGSGKSTLLHFLALLYAQGPEAVEARLGLSGPDARRLPVFAPLAAYDDMLRRCPDLSLVEFLGRYYDLHRGLPALGPVFAHALETGRALVLLDGLDEVLDVGARQFVASQVAALIGEWLPRGNRVVVTSRFFGYRQARLAGDLPHYSLLDFGRREIEQFAHGWALAYETWVDKGARAPQTVRRAQDQERRLLEQVRSNPSVERLAANPLMLTMLALLSRQLIRLPDRRIELYERYLRTLLENWELARSEGARQRQPERIDPHQAIRILIPLALWLHRAKPSGTARRAELLPRLSRLLLEDWHGAVEAAPVEAVRRAEAEAGRFLGDMRQFSGLIVERGHDAFGFLHLTFQEYLTARALARLEAADRLALLGPCRHDDRWREPILLCAGQLGVVENRRDEASALVRALLDAGCEHEPILRRDLLLAAACAAADANLEPALLADIAVRLAELLHHPAPALTRQAARALARLGRLEAARPPARAALEGALGAAEWRLRRIAAQEIAPLLAEDAALRAAVAGRLADDDWPVRRAAVEALAPLLAEDAALRAAVADRLTDEDEYVRGEAVQALAPLLADDAALRAAVAGRLADGEEFVRWVAVEALTPLLPGDAALRAAVAHRLAADEWPMRQTAVETVAPLLAGDAALRAAVADHLVDKEEYVRQAAVEALAPLLADNAALRQQYLSSPQWDLRRRVIEALGAMQPLDEASLDLLAGQLRCLDTLESGPARVVVITRALAPLLADHPALRAAVAGRLADEDEFVRQVAVAALVPLLTNHPYLRAGVADRLADENVFVRWVAIKALSPLLAGDAGLRAAVADCLTADDRRQSQAACLALAPLLADDAALRAAVADRLADEEEYMRRAAVVALTPLLAGDAALRDAVAGRLADEDSYVCQAAIQALLPLLAGDAALRAAVADRLADKSSDARRAAVEALAPLLADDALRAAVADRLADDDLFVRQAAVEALAPLLTDDALRAAVADRLADEKEYVRRAAIEALAPLLADDADLRAAVADRLADDDWRARQAAVEALAPLLADDAALRAAVADRLADEDWRARQAAVAALAPLLADDDALCAAVADRLADDEWSVRQAAVVALAPLLADDAALRAAVADRLADDDWPVRGAAAQSLMPLLAGWPELIPRCLPWLACAEDNRAYGLRGSSTIAAAEVRDAVARAVGPLLPGRPDLFDQVSALLARPDWPARDGAARALAAAPGGLPPAALPALLRALDDRRGLESWPARLAAAAALLNDLRHADEAIAVALQALDYGTAPTEFLDSARKVRREAALILGRLEPVYRRPAVWERLARLLREDEDDDARDAAYHALLALAQAPPDPAPGAF